MFITPVLMEPIFNFKKKQRGHDYMRSPQLYDFHVLALQRTLLIDLPGSKSVPNSLPCLNIVQIQLEFGIDIT